MPTDCLAQTPDKCANVWWWLSFHVIGNKPATIRTSSCLKCLSSCYSIWKQYSGKWGFLLCLQILHSKASFWSYYCIGRWLECRRNQWSSLALRWKIQRFCHKPFHGHSFFFFFFWRMCFLWPTSADKKNDFAILLWHYGYSELFPSVVV